jgi:hypothetical protein
MCVSVFLPLSLSLCVPLSPLIVPLTHPTFKHRHGGEKHLAAEAIRERECYENLPKRKRAKGTKRVPNAEEQKERAVSAVRGAGFEVQALQHLQKIRDQGGQKQAKLNRRVLTRARARLKAALDT